MAERYTRHMNDRREGRQLYTLPAYARIQPYILRHLRLTNRQNLILVENMFLSDV